MNTYLASAFARDAMLEPVVVNLDLDDKSLTGTASENEMRLSRYEMKL